MPQSLQNLISAVNHYIVNPLILLLFAVAMVVFLWGIIGYIKGAGDPKARESGRNHILWGLVGMAIMFSVFGIMHIIAGTLGVSPDAINSIQKL